MHRRLLALSASFLATGCFGAPQAVDPFLTQASPPASAEPPATPPPPPPVGPDGSDQEDDGGDESDGGDEQGSDELDDIVDKAAVRFLMQTTFGPREHEVEAVRGRGYAGWIADQMALPVRPHTLRARASDAGPRVIDALFWEAAIEGRDQLRQRVTFALSQIVVVSNADNRFGPHPEMFAAYADILQEEAFGNYEDLIRRVARNPAMGVYLSSLGNAAADPELGTAADENFARELLQLFTIGLDELTPGGEPTGRPSYATEDVAGLAKVFTGLSYADGRWKGQGVDPALRTVPMQAFAEAHDQTDKTFLGTTIPGGLAPDETIERALSHVLAHPNVAPFVCRQLIQRLVTSNPSPAYVERVGAAYEAGLFEADGQSFGEGRRGDMAAVVAAILLDDEARAADFQSQPTYGKLRSPLLRFAHVARTLRDGRHGESLGEPVPVKRLAWADRPGKLGQRAFAPPSVFGYGRPGYAAPGSWVLRSGLASPEASMASGTSMIGYVNFMEALIGQPDAQVDGFEFFWLDVSDLAAMAAQPDEMVARLDLLLTGGRMMEATRTRIADAVATIPLDGDARQPERRARAAVFMAVTAPAYVIQR